MKTKTKKSASEKKTNTASKAYLTTRILASAAKKGSKKAAKETLKVMGYNVVVENDKVIKKYSDGRVEIVTVIEKSTLNGKKLLD